MDHCCPTETQSDADAHVDEIGPERVGNPLVEALVARLPGAAAVISERGLIVDANEGFCRLAGFERDALVGRMISLLDGIPDVTGADRDETVEPPSWISPVVVVCADGSQAHILATFERIDHCGTERDGYLIEARLTAVPTARLLRHRKLPRPSPTSTRRQRPGPSIAARSTRHVTSEIELAAERGEFFSRYQPIVSLRDGRIEAFEALLRWNHPTHGVVGPGAFIGEAESREVLAQITQQILHDACHAAAHWNEIGPDLRPVSVSVNLCGSQLRDPHLIGSIAQAIADSQLDPALLWLEITENTGVTEAARDPALLNDIRSLGPKLVLDDFGIGYASLGSVRKLSLDILKFDRSLVAGAAANRCDARILAAGIEIAHALEIDVIAEGIEQHVQVEYLRTLDCTSGQGFYFSRPLDHERADLLIAELPTWPLAIAA